MFINRLLPLLIMIMACAAPCQAADNATRLNVQDNLAGLRQSMDSKCEDEETKLLGLSISQCTEQKQRAIFKCTSITGEGLAQSITFDEFEQVLFPRVSYCMLLERSGLNYSNESGDKFRHLIQYQQKLASK